MKKMLALTICAALMISLSGCQNNSQPQKPVEKPHKIAWENGEATETVKNWKYRIKKAEEGNGIRIMEATYTGKDSETLTLNIPSRIGGMTVVGVGQNYDDLDESYEFNNSLLGVPVEEPHDCTGESKLSRKIVEVTLPDSVKTIEPSAFSGFTRLKEIALPKNLTDLGENAFYACRSLEKISFPDQFAAFSSNVFKGCDKITDIRISDKNPSLYEKDGYVISKGEQKLLYASSGKREMNVPEGVKILGEESLKYSQMQTVTIPESVVEIQKEALAAPNVKGIDLQGTNPVYEKEGHCIFDKRNGALSVVEWENGVLEISPKVKIIDDHAMSAGVAEDWDVKKVVIGENVEKVMGDWLDAFHECVNYEFKGEKPPVVSKPGNGFCGVPVFCKIVVPSNSVARYKKWIKDHGASKITKVKKS